MKLSETKEGTIIEIYVKLDSPTFEVRIENDEIVVRCTQDPVKGKVNREIIKEFSKFLNAKIEIVTGTTSRQKRLLIRAVDKGRAEFLLREASKTTAHL